MNNINRHVLVTVEVDKNERLLINEIKSAFPDSDVFEVNSINTNDIVQIFIPLAALMAPTVKDIVTKICDCRNVSFKHNGTEISGSYNKVVKLLNMIKEETEKDDSSSNI